jgi:hypothetical protein
MKLRLHTQFSRLYYGTYWGQGTNTPEPDIIANRDALGPYLRSYAGRHIPQYVRKAAFPDICPHHGTTPPHCDHTEYYKNVDGDWIVLTSPYLGAVQKGEEIPNWALLPPMYSGLAATYGCRIPKRGRRGPLPKVAIAWNPFTCGYSPK